MVSIVLSRQSFWVGIWTSPTGFFYLDLQHNGSSLFPHHPQCSAIRKLVYKIREITFRLLGDFCVQRMAMKNLKKNDIYLKLHFISFFRAPSAYVMDLLKGLACVVVTLVTSFVAPFLQKYRVNQNKNGIFCKIEFYLFIAGTCSISLSKQYVFFTL